jgi:DNA/RNA endonuclease YhcR with UshA esterase domain
MKVSKTARPVFVTLLALLMTTAQAHHSAALFYDLDGNIEISGTVTEFRFANPHAVLKLDVVGDDGAIQHWTAETTSPSILRRRGWSQDSFKAGEKVRIQGLPSVDGTYLVRITRAFREDGTEIGVPRGTDN